MRAPQRSELGCSELGVALAALLSLGFALAAVATHSAGFDLLESLTVLAECPLRVVLLPSPEFESKL